MLTRLRAWLFGPRIEPSYSAQVRAWGASEPFIRPLPLPEIQALKAKPLVVEVKPTRKRKRRQPKLAEVKPFRQIG